MTILARVGDWGELLAMSCQWPCFEKGNTTRQDRFAIRRIKKSWMSPSN